MEPRSWPVFAAALGGAFAMAMAVWPGGMLRGGIMRAAENPQLWFLAHLIAGTFGLVGVGLINRQPAAGRLLIGLGALALVAVVVLEPFDIMTVVTTILPAILLVAAAATIQPLARA
jgi:hypothetical protein